MKKAGGCLGVILALFILPFQIYLSWLLYHHIKSTEVMWFLWWITTVGYIVFSILNAVVNYLLKDD